MPLHPAGDLRSPSAGSARDDASTGSVDSAPASQQGCLHLLHHQASTESSTGSGGLEMLPASERPRRSQTRPHQSNTLAGRAVPDKPPCTSSLRQQQAHIRWLDGPGSKGWPCSAPQPRQTQRLSDLMLGRSDADLTMSPLRFSRRLAAKHWPEPVVAGSSPAGASGLAEVAEPGHAPSKQNPGRVSSPAGRPKLSVHASPGMATDRPRVVRGSTGGSRSNVRGLRPTARDNPQQGGPEEKQPAAGTFPLDVRQGGGGTVTAVQATAVLAAAIKVSDAQESPGQCPRSDVGQAQAVPAAAAAVPELQRGLRKRPRWGKQSSLQAPSLAEQLGGPHKRPCCSRQSLPGTLPLAHSLPHERTSPGASTSGGSGRRRRSAAGPHSAASTRQRQVGLLHAAASALPVAARELPQLPRADATDHAPTAGSKGQQRQGGQPKAERAALRRLAPAAGSKPQRKLADLSTAASSTLQGPGRELQQWPTDLPTAGSSTLQGGTPAAVEIPQPKAPRARRARSPSSSSLPGQRPPLVTRTLQPKRSLPMRLKSSTQLHAMPVAAGRALSRAASPEAGDACGSWQWERCAASNSPEPGHNASRQQQEAAVAAEQRRAAAAATAAAAEEKRVAEAAALVAEQSRAAAAQAQQRREREDSFLEALNQVGRPQAQQLGSCLHGAAS